MGEGIGGRGSVRLSEIIYKNGSAFAKSQYSIFVQGGVRRQDAFGETLDHCAGEGEVLFSIKERLAQLFNFQFTLGHKNWESRDRGEELIAKRLE